MKKNVIFCIIFFALISLPYFLNISQDLPTPVLHDEAAYHLNAKNALLFGISALDDRLTCILVPLQFLIGLVSFSVLGVSLFSLRLPYIILNILGNILFFDFIRRVRGVGAAFAATAVFAFYFPRLIFGKSAMAESLALALVLILIWLFLFTSRNIKVYYMIGVLGMFVLLTKLDNIFVPMALTFFVLGACVKSSKLGQHDDAKKIAGYYLMGCASVLILVFMFYSLMGWDKVIYQFNYVLSGNLKPDVGQNIPSWYPETKYAPFTVQLFIYNLKILYSRLPGFLLVILIGSVACFILAISSDRRKDDRPLL